MGHMAQPRQHIRSTQSKILGAPALEPMVPTTTTLEVEIIPTSRIFTDDTGRFTPRSRGGNQYIMVCLHTQSNAILVRAFQSKSDTHRIGAYSEIYNRLKARNMAPTEHILDNEVSAAFKKAITNNNCTFQLVHIQGSLPHNPSRRRANFPQQSLGLTALTSGTHPQSPAPRRRPYKIGLGMPLWTV